MVFEGVSDNRASRMISGNFKGFLNLSERQIAARSLVDMSAHAYFMIITSIERRIPARLFDRLCFERQKLRFLKINDALWTTYIFI